jgi:hypothetical protein
MSLALLLLACADKRPDTADIGGAESLIAVTFNTGTTETIAPDEGNGGYTSEQAATSDAYYGDGLAWIPAVEAAAAFFADLDPDVVVFQEIFWTGECPDIPEEHRTGFICEGWQEGDPTVAQVILGEDFQVMCHPGKPDKCAAVNRRLGTFRGCDQDLCLEGMDGFDVDGCGSGARVGRAVIERADGGELTLVNFHGTSGLSGEEEDCRVAQVDQVFVDLGDGAPGASGARNLVMGDLNTDPGRWTEFDDSAARWHDFVGEGLAFDWITEVGEDAPGTYGGVADIDHVVSDAWTGACVTPGLTEGLPAVFEDAYFDHRPAVCELVLP